MALKIGTIILLIISVVLLVLSLVADGLRRDFGLSKTGYWTLSLWLLIFAIIYQFFVGDPRITK